MKTTNLLVLREGKFVIETNSITRFAEIKLSVLIFILTLCSFNGISQQKNIDHQALQNKLVLVDAEIQEIDEKMTAVNARIQGVPPEEVSPAILTQLSELQLRKDQYLREKQSIEAVLNPAQNITQSKTIVEIPKETFLALPKENQNEILAHPERYKVIENN